MSKTNAELQRRYRENHPARLDLRITSEQKDALKAAAAERGITIKALVEEIIEAAVQKKVSGCCVPCWQTSSLPSLF